MILVATLMVEILPIKFQTILFNLCFVMAWQNFRPYVPNFRKFHQTIWILPIFFIFCQFWLFFGQKGQNRKKVFCSIRFCLEASTYKSSENYIKRFEFCQFSSFLVNFGCFLAKKRPKNAKIEK